MSPTRRADRRERRGRRARASGSRGFASLNVWAILGLVVITVVVFAPIRHHDFVTWDDGPYVTDNPIVLDGLTWRGLGWAWTTATAPYWHPLTWMSHMLDVELFGPSPGGHHLTSLLIHLVSTLLLFWLLRSLTGRTGRSAFVAAMFAVHPLHVESVAWIAERKDVLSALFWFASLLAYVRYAQHPGLMRYALVLILFALGLTAKPMLVTLPLVLLLLDFWPLGRWTGSAPAARSRLFLEKVPMVILAAGIGIATFMIQSRVGAVAALEGLPISHRLANAVMSYAGYIQKMLWPVNLGAFYPYPRSMPDWWALALTAAGLAGVSVAAVLMARARPYVLVGWLWYLVTLVPVIGVVQVGEQAMADRFTYVPMVGLFVIAAWLVPDLLERFAWRRVALPSLAVILVAASAGVARAQVRHWQDGRSLWERALDVTTDNYYAHSALGALLADEGDVREAVRHQQEALRIRPSDPDAHNELGKIRAEQGDLAEAVRHFSQAVRGHPMFAEAHHNLGMALLNQGRADEAIGELQEALQIAPGLAKAHNALGRALGQQGRPREAAAHFVEALRLRPDMAEARYNLGVSLDAQGQADAAVAEYREAVRVAPDFVEAHARLATALAALGKLDEGIDVLVEALRRSPDRPDLHYNAAVLYHRRGMIERAIQHLELSLRKDPGYRPAAEMLTEIKKRAGAP